MSAVLDINSTALAYDVLNNPHTSLADRYRAVRAATELLCSDLQPEDTVAQSMPDASPVKWHLAHTSWFFETFILEKAMDNFKPFHTAFRVLFNSYYNVVGEQYLRPQRGLISRPTLAEVYQYRQHIDQSMLQLLNAGALSDDLLAVLDVGLHHEQQHQELMLTDLKHLFSFNPLNPAFRDCPTSEVLSVEPYQWHRFAEGLYPIGHADKTAFAFDNEGPMHQVFLQSFALASRLITNGEYIAFIEDQGYQQAGLWLSDAWAVLKKQSWQAPLYWRKVDNVWHTLTLSGLRAVRLDEPVVHISYYEADAYARWAGARLPTEQEWEVAAAGTNLQGNFIDTGLLQPEPAKLASGLQQMFGDVWEWTQSPYSAYPGYAAPDNELAEYNGKFMCNQMVLRGGSCVTAQSHMRASYRNFFFPEARWQYSGLRLAKNL